MKKKKKSIEAKLVKFAHRRRFQDYVREKGREKMTLSYVYWCMYHRSGKGDVFELEEERFLGDLGIGKNALRPARKTLFNDGWLSKAQQKIDPLTGKWGTTAWTVNTEPVAHSEGFGTVAPLTGDRSADARSSGDRSEGDTVVLHTLYASNPEASTSSSTPNGVTSSSLVSKQVSGALCPPEEKEPENLEFVSEDKSKTNPEDEGIVRQLRQCFPVFEQAAKPTPKDIRLMTEIVARLDEYFVLPRQCMEFARKHKQSTPGLIPRSPQGLWEAVCGEKATANPTNNLAAQTKDHDPAVCGICVKELHAKPCDHCHATTWGKPVIENGHVYCQECMKLPSYRRESGKRSFLGAEA